MPASARAERNTRIGSVRILRAAYSITAADGPSSHWTSSTATRTGPRTARRARRSGTMRRSRREAVDRRLRRAAGSPRARVAAVQAARRPPPRRPPRAGPGARRGRNASPHLPGCRPGQRALFPQPRRRRYARAWSCRSRPRLPAKAPRARRGRERRDPRPFLVPPDDLARHLCPYHSGGGHESRPSAVAARRRTRCPLGGGSAGPAQTATLTGEVAIQIAVPRKTAHPIESITTRSLGDVSFVLIPAKKSAEANRTTPST